MSITFNLLLVAIYDSASDSKSVVESLVETDDEEGRFLFLVHTDCFFLLLFLSVFSDSELEDILSLLFLNFFCCLSTFLFGESFSFFALPTTFSAGSSGESPALPLFFHPSHYLMLTPRHMYFVNYQIILYSYKGGPERTSTFRGGCWEIGGDRGVAIFTHKN